MRELREGCRFGWRFVARDWDRLPPPARSSAAFAATTPRSTAESEASEPPNLPMGVRAAERMYASFNRVSRTLQFSRARQRLYHRGHRENTGKSPAFVKRSPLCSSVLPVVRN